MLQISRNDIPIYLSAFTKGITGKWTRELFKISKINDTKPMI